MQFNNVEKQHEVFGMCNKLINDWAIHTMQQMDVQFDIDSDNAPYLQFLNYQRKIIQPKLRKVSYATNFKVSDENSEGIKNLIGSIEKGDDINKYLSKLILKGNISDGMLDHFGCKHFHLGNKQANDFVKRTGEIALAFVTDAEIFFIEAKLHGKDHPLIWYEDSVIRILHNERPDLIAEFKSKYMKNISPNFSNPEDLKKMRDMNVNNYVVIDNETAYSINLGNTLGGLGFEFTQIYISHSRLMFSTIYKTLDAFSTYHKGSAVVKSIELYDLISDDFKIFSQFKLDIHYVQNNQSKKFTQEFNFHTK
ncbi:hypothetical protein F994_02789 [Acinetobacter bohemicus ANC 3994]|uniref:Uncharacterized protein n=1 Tax=Acinetobacter bohemicus ANC 3994 TaxID=1217715 RepID=N8Q9S2_9GAMM|nr:hypothetical protein [Acinetobacter bohemicus]ENU18662.1 hypothetical protein F994_02789 [Acinetobacter bohemicus ANC 3994]